MSSLNGKLYTQAVGGTEITTASTIVAVSGEAIVYFRPNDNFNGPASFTYNAVDNNSILSAAATASITVNAVNDPASITNNNPNAQVIEDNNPTGSIFYETTNDHAI